MPDWIDKETAMARQRAPRTSGHVSWMAEAPRRVEIEPDLFRTSRRIDLWLLTMMIVLVVGWGGLIYYVAVSIMSGR